MYRNLVTSLLDHERVRTTDAKAKGVRSLAEKMITLGKRGDLHARRRALRVIRRREIAAKVFDDLAERYRERPGGYTRIVKLGIRPGDAAAMSIIELVEAEATGKAKSKPAKKSAKAKSESKKKVPASKDDEAASGKSRKKKVAVKKKATTKKKAASKKKSD
jgi:large subunit ribosomal protein L17